MNPIAGKKILVVDPRATERKIQEIFLRDMGCGEVLHSSEAEDAWVLIKRFKLDIVISSWRLGTDMNGLALLKIVRADDALGLLPFLLCLVEATRGQVLAAGQAGVSDIVLKPYSRVIFERKVQKALSPDEDPRVRESAQLFELGERLMRKKDYDGAVSCFKQVLEVFEKAEVYYNIGYIKTAQGRYEEAIMAFRRAAQIDGAFAQAYRKMGEVYAKLGRRDEAAECLSKAAEIFLEKRMEGDAEQSLRDVLKLTPNTPNVFNSLGIVYRRQGKPREAIRMFMKALKVSPADEHIHYNLARVLVSENRFEDAARILKSALTLNRDFDEAANLLRSIELGLTTA
ncbi:MAG: tetratricopeptide repeat protein [Pseudomonadota bacterium]